MNGTTLNIILTLVSAIDVALMYIAKTERLKKLVAAGGVVLLILVCCAAYVRFPSESVFVRAVCALPAAAGVFIMRLNKNLAYSKMRLLISSMLLVSIVLLWI